LAVFVPSAAGEKAEANPIEYGQEPQAVLKGILFYQGSRLDAESLGEACPI